MSFEIDGLDKWKEELAELNERFPSEKEKEMKKLGLIGESQIKPLIPVDTGRLRNSVFNQVIDSDTVEVIANTNYAEYVNNGHMVRGVKVADSSAYRGMRKHNPNSYVKGIHFMEKGLQNTEPLAITEIEKWLNSLFNKE